VAPGQQAEQAAMDLGQVAEELTLQVVVVQPLMAA